MLPLRKTAIIFYTIAIIGNVRGIRFNTRNCNKTLDSSNCTYDVYCSDVHVPGDNDVNSFEYYIFNVYNSHVYEVGDYDEIRRVNRDVCKKIEYYYSSSNDRFYPLHLTYRRYYILDAVDQIFVEGRRNPTNVLVTQLDLSYNNYEYIPTLNEMINLVLLNISNNALKIAELSNAVDIPKLTEIDLSHNTIYDIIYESGHVYRRLRKIDLSFNYLTKIPEAVFDPFNELDTLDLSHNYIETLSPITFEGMKQLKHLNISFNRISDINSSLFRFIELSLLDLSNNNIETIKASDFSKLTNLITVKLSSNFISDIDKDAFCNMKYLRNIYLNNNKLGDVDKNIFISIITIENIDLSENVFKKIPKNLFRSKHISRFSIKDNQLEGSLENGMFEGLAVKKLDLSNQYLDSVEDYAFNGLVNLEELLLNNNNISVLTVKSFNTLLKLTKLDLSFNKIQSIEFEKHYLYNLLSLSLRNNYLTIVRQENFHGFNRLQFLDLSDNKITQVESNSFVSLKELINFQISNNPLNGTLEESTFDGFSSLPSLDISCTLLSSVQNGSFVGMVQLKNLNVSHSKINNLEYNIFIHTGVLETLDLSFNELNDFKINSTELAHLSTLYLNNNLLKMLDSSTFKSIISLCKLSLAHNVIQNMTYEFKSQRDLRQLDVSHNSNLNVTFSFLNATKYLDILDLSGIKTNISFANIKDISLTHLIITNSSLSDVKKMQLSELRHLDDLKLSCNEIYKLEVGTFCNLSTIRFLDLSNNKIKYIEPGIFKDNTMLVSLNVSHNFLAAISYGIFHGLIYLSTLDISYNHIKDLENERFYEVNRLNILIADHNKIETITAEEFVGTRLTKLSIGGNPIPCEVLVNLKRRGVPFEITASNLYENNDENVHGVTCNRKPLIQDRIANVSNNNSPDNANILLSIRDIMLDLLNNKQTNKPTTNFDEKYLINITDQFKISSTDINKKISIFLNSTADVLSKNNETSMLLSKIHTTIANNDTNVLLNKILRVLTLNSATRAPPVQVTKDNATYENLLSYINKVKQDLENTFKMAKDSILNEMEAKIEAKIPTPIAYNATKNNILLPTETPKHEKFSVSDNSKSYFTETCVALILVILVGFVLFKVYKSGVFVRQSFSVSTRELPGSMDSTL